MPFERLLSALAAVELAGEPERTQSFFVNRLKHLPIGLGLEQDR